MLTCDMKFVYNILTDGIAIVIRSSLITRKCSFVKSDALLLGYESFLRLTHRIQSLVGDNETIVSYPRIGLWMLLLLPRQLFVRQGRSSSRSSIILLINLHNGGSMS